MTAEMSIEKRVAMLPESGAADREETRFFLQMLIEKQARESKHIVRNIALMFLAIALFELVSRKSLAEAEILGIKVNEFTFAKLAIPAVVSYFFLRAMISSANRVVYRDVLNAFTQRYFQAWYASGLYALYTPRPAGLVSIDVDFYKAGKGRRLLNMIDNAEAAATFLVPITFGTYAYFRLFSDKDLSVVPCVISLVAAVALYIVGVLHLAYVETTPDQK